MILPPGTDPSATIIIEGAARTLESEVMRLEELYRALREQLHWKPEDARQFLPNGVETAICVTCNFREWREIFRQRCSHFAHWEIREVMLRLLKDFYEYLPVLFEDIYLEFYKNL
jgi:thymidylate synthase (FAD)